MDMIKQQLKEIYDLLLKANAFSFLDQDEITEKLEYVHDLDEVDTEIENLLQSIRSSRVKNNIAGDLITLRRNLLDYDSCLLDAQEEIKKVIKKLSQ